MKKIYYFLLLLVIFKVTNVSAASVNITSSKLNAYTTDKVTITVKVVAGAWNLHIAGANIEDKIVGYDLEGNITTTKTYTLDTQNTGKYTITLTGDYTDYDTEETKNISTSVVVNVTKKEIKNVENNSATTNINNNTNTGTNKSNQNNNVTEENESEIVVVKKPSKITNFHIVGYDIDFSEDKMSYDVNVPSDLKELYILVEGEGITASNDKIVNIENKSYITVSVRADDKSINYRINLKREKSEIKDIANTKKKSFIEKIPLLSNIILVIALILLFLKYKKAKNNI